MEMMHQGKVPEKTCEEVVKRVCQGVGTLDLEMGIIAMNIKVNIKEYKNDQSFVHCDRKTPPPGLPPMLGNPQYTPM